MNLRRKKMSIVENRKAYFNYFIESEYIAGMVLFGSEVKSIAQNNINMGDCFCQFDDNGELWLLNMHISPWDNAGKNNHEPMRQRKLLLNKKELHKISILLERSGYTAVPLKIIVKNKKFKCVIGIGKGKKLYDKKESIKAKDIARETQRELKG
jgi:SsrA-binding protein